jgi:hypothetical protein
MTESEAKKIIKLLERISNQLSTISEDVAYVVSREKARDQLQDEEVKKLREQSRIGISAGKKWRQVHRKLSSRSKTLTTVFDLPRMRSSSEVTHSAVVVRWTS